MGCAAAEFDSRGNFSTIPAPNHTTQSTAESFFENELDVILTSCVIPLPSLVPIFPGELPPSVDLRKITFPPSVVFLQDFTSMLRVLPILHSSLCVDDVALYTTALAGFGGVDSPD